MFSDVHFSNLALLGSVIFLALAAAFAVAFLFRLLPKDSSSSQNKVHARLFGGRLRIDSEGVIAGFLAVLAAIAFAVWGLWQLVTRG